jgi:hypothetical protein
MAQDVKKKIFKKLNIKHDKKITLNPLRTTSIVSNPFTEKVSHEKIKEIIQSEKVRTKDDLLKRRLSLPSLRHFNDQELEKILKDLDLE